jgi:chaperonin GroEL (HSP60 family)
MRDYQIMDSKQNLINALKDSVSIGSLLLTTEVLISRVKPYFPKPLSNYSKEQF